MAAPTNLLKGFARTVALAKPHATKRTTLSDPDTRGLFVRITPKGAKTWTIVARNPLGKQVWREIGPVEDFDLETARTKAKEGVARIRRGEEPFPEVVPPKLPDTFKVVSDRFIKLYVKDPKRLLRSAPEIERHFKVHLWPNWGKRPFVDVRRSDIVALLDDISAERGAGEADHVLATISKLCAWYTTRDEDYVSPIVRGMKRTRPSEQARKRTLDDDEIRTVWNAATGTFGAFIKLCLLTAQRKAKVAAMRWDDISEDGVWTIPIEPREKGNAGRLRLPPLAMEIISAQPRIEENPYVLAGRGKKHINGFSKARQALDVAILEKRKQAAIEAGDDPEAVTNLKHWVIHDLRRTAKSLMARAKVRPDISERVLGHTIKGVEGVYDRFEYFEEKSEALEKLAGLVELIRAPSMTNVTRIESAKRH